MISSGKEDSPNGDRTYALYRSSSSIGGSAGGSNLKLTYEYEDPEHRVRNNAETRASVLYEYTPIQFLQLRAGYRRYMGIPQSDTQNQSLGFAESAHILLLMGLSVLGRRTLLSCINEASAAQAFGGEAGASFASL